MLPAMHSQWTLWNEGVVKFAHFPTEILSSIIQALDGFDIGNLWLTGDAILCARMESGGVTRFKLKLRQERTRKWPKLISRFRHLEYLSIGPKANHSIWFQDVDLLGVSRTLKHLRMDFENSELVLLGIPYVVEDSHPDPILSPLTHAEMRLSPFPLAEHFIELHSLVLNGKFALPHILVPHLPQTLLRLRVPYHSISAAMIRSLSPNLMSLELPNVENLEETTVFPSGLTRLDLPLLNTLDSSVMSRMPASVTDLDILNCAVDNLKLVDYLPPNLTSLKSNYYDYGARDRLPRSLRRLKTIGCDTVANFDFFPPGLQYLMMWNSGAVSSEEFSLLPRTLTKLSITNMDVTEDCLKFLPDNLRSLSLNIDFENPDSAYGFMKSLEVINMVAIDTKALVFMPRLTKITTEFVTVGSDWRELKGLSSLQKLVIYGSTILNLQFVHCLPPSLKHLEIYSNSDIDPSVAQHLPRSLSFLSLDGQGTITESFAADLPPHLTRLHCNLSDTNSDQIIRLLPRSLEVLYFSHTSKITNEGIRHLPPSLTHFHMGYASLLTNQCAALFPRHMTFLVLYSATLLTNDAIPHFPRSLTRLGIGMNTHINEDCFPHLPPLLNSFSKEDIITIPKRISSTDSFISALIRKLDDEIC